MNEFNNKSHAQIEKKIKKRNYVPRGWRIRKIKEISEVLRGASPRPISDPKWFSSESNIGWVRISDVTKSKKILRKTEQYVSKEGMRKSRLVKKDNIIMSIAATVGKPIYTGFDVCIHDGFVVFNNLKVNKEYFYYLLESKEKQWGKYGQTGSQMNLNSSIVGNETVLIPDDELEQQKIAKILSTWDKAIELKEKLIEQKKELKKGLMQKLLTGEVRLPGFEGEWKQIKLGKLVKLQGGYAFKSSEFRQEGIPIIRISNIVPEITDYEQEFVYYDKIDISENFLVKTGDILIAMSGATTGKVGIYKKNEIAYLNQRVGKFVNLEGKSLDYDFLYYLVKSPMFKLQLREELATGAQPNISSKQIENFRFRIPSLEEQEGISSILKQIDKSISLQKKEIDLLVKQKKGLMQLLLTGKVRVKV